MESNEIFGSTVSAQDAAKEPVAEKKKAGRKPKTASENSTVKKATPVKTAEVKDEKPVVTEKKKPGRKPKTASEKPAETKKPAAKTTATKKTTAKKTTAKKTTAKKTTAKVAAKNTVYIQFNGRQVDYDEVLKKVAADCKKQKASSKDVTLYIKPEDNACYYVANNGIAGKVDLY